jgi:hypothetical protein
MADRATVNATTGVSPYYFITGTNMVLPIELTVPTWSTLPWSTIEDRSDLIAMRARQIERRDSDVREALFRAERMRENNADYSDDRHTLRTDPLEEGHLVLLHDTQKAGDMSAVQKLKYRWLGPYKIAEVKGNGSYAIAELDGTRVHHIGDLGDAFNGDRLKRFYPRSDDIEQLPRRRRPGRPRAQPAAPPAEPSADQPGDEAPRDLEMVPVVI